MTSTRKCVEQLSRCDHLYIVFLWYSHILLAYKINWCNRENKVLNCQNASALLYFIKQTNVYVIRSSNRRSHNLFSTLQFADRGESLNRALYTWSCFLKFEHDYTPIISMATSETSVLIFHNFKIMTGIDGISQHERRSVSIWNI